MEYITEGLLDAISMILSFNREMIMISLLSIRVSVASTIFASLIGVPVGFYVAVKDFRMKRWIAAFLRALMAFPAVVVGLLVYSFISRRGPMGNLSILYTPCAMIIGQTLLAFPTIAALSLSAIQGMDKRVEKTARTLGAGEMQTILFILFEGRYVILAAVITGFSRVFSEVGLSMILGGNIRGYTRNITTAIALETAKGEFTLGIALGIILLTIALLVNILLNYLQKRGNY